MPGLGGPPSIGTPLDGDDLGVVDHAIDERRGGGGVGEDRRPLAEGEVGGQDEATAFVAPADDLEEQVGGAGVVSYER